MDLSMYAIQCGESGQCFSMHDVEKDGNCFFRSLCKHPYFKKKGLDYRSLRTDVAQKMKDALQSSDGYWLKGAIAHIYYIMDPHVGESTSNLLNYIDNCLSVDTEWVGQIEVLLIMLIYDVKVKILTSRKTETANRDERFLPFSEYETSFASTSLLQMDYVYKWLDLRNPSDTITIFLHEHSNPFTPSDHRKNHYLYLYPISESNLSSYIIASEPSKTSPPTSKPKYQQDDGLHLKQNQKSAKTKIAKSKKDIPKKKGNSKGDKIKLTSYTQKEKFRLVRYFVENKQMYKSIRDYLRSVESDPLTISQRSPFQRWLKDYNCGNLRDTDKEIYRRRDSIFKPVESKLLQYINSQEEHRQLDSVALSWKDLKAKALSIWETLPTEQKEGLKLNFTASDGWLDRFLKRQDLSLRGLQRQSNKLADERKAEAHVECPYETQELVTEYEIINSDQPTFYFNQLPHAL